MTTDEQAIRGAVEELRVMLKLHIRSERELSEGLRHAVLALRRRGADADADMAMAAVRRALAILEEA